jgi:magnesium-transporting ATPase (P-type)
MKRKVAVIGEGLNDVQAFDQADVFFAMGSGKSVAHKKASMVLLYNNFDSCVKAILRGRNIYANIKRFLQFQITVNFSILVIIFIGVIFLTESPFNAVMLIWINLVMDVLGALALATALAVLLVVVVAVLGLDDGRALPWRGETFRATISAGAHDEVLAHATWRCRPGRCPRPSPAPLAHRAARGAGRGDESHRRQEQ